jgi:hypothetical protein
VNGRWLRIKICASKIPDGGTFGQRREAWRPPAFMCEEILTGDP